MHGGGAMKPAKTGVLLVNLGTPDAPTPKAVRRFLKSFLSDRRVVEMPRPLWWLLLHLLVLPFRPRHAAKLYQNIWQQDSPQRLHGEQLAAKLTKKLGLPVMSAMCHGQPSLHDCLDELQRRRVERLLVVPLFPQYSATTTAGAVDKLAAWAAKQRELPELHVIKDYWQEPAWQQVVANRIQLFQARAGKPDKLVFSFHGIPQAYENKGDRYPERCRASAEAIAERLGLADDDWLLCFQSRFGRARWVKPYTDVTLKQLAKDGVENVQVVCPGFAVDCLETIDEVARLLRDDFIAAGGKRLDYIPALNASDGQQGWLTKLIERKL